MNSMTRAKSVVNKEIYKFKFRMKWQVNPQGQTGQSFMHAQDGEKGDLPSGNT